MLLGLKPVVRVTLRNNITGEVINLPPHENLIMTAGKGLVGDMLIDESGYDTGLTRVALGTGSTAPAVTQTQLVSEVARAAPSTRTRDGNTITLSTYFAAALCAYSITEAGVFGHSTATDDPDTGIMFSRWLETIDNSSGLYDITIDYSLTIQEVTS